MSIRNLDRIFKPGRIALIGATDSPGRLGDSVIGNLLSSNFRGVVYPVNPGREGIRGIPAFPDLESLPAIPDLALICSPATEVPDIVERCGQVGVPGLLILSGGFQETGAHGKALESAIADRAARYDGMRILGPNSLGIIAPRAGLNASHAMTQPLPGHLAFISESRALCNSVIDWATEQGIGFSHFVSIGNMLDVGFGDLIDYFNKDPHTRAIILYLQSIKHVRSFMSAARAFARTKPIVAYKAGRFEASARVAASHTGAMVAEDAVYDAAFERAGVVRVTELDDVFDVAELLAARSLPKGPRLAILGNAGGPSVIAVDALLARGGELASLSAATIEQLDRALPPVGSHRNPIDLLDSAPPERFAVATRILIADPNTDGVLVVFAAQSGVDPLASAKLVAEVAQEQSKPVLAVWMGGARVRAGIQLLNSAGLATHSSPEQGVRAFMHMVSYSRNLEALYETPREIPVQFNTNRNNLRKRLTPMLRRKRQQLSENNARDFLRAYDIPVVASSVARSVEEAVRHADRLGYPVVLKVTTPELVHKVDVGGVALNLPDATAVRLAYREITEATAGLRTDARVFGVTVQEMISVVHSHELILGAKQDPTFGAVIMVGAGGVATAVLKDQALGLPPLNERLARRMLESLRIWPMLLGFRGRPRVDLDRLIEIMIRFSYLICDYPEILEFDINPLLVTPKEVVALDATVVADHRAAESNDPYRHLAIRPYPEEYIRHVSLKDRTEVTLRPVKPEDEQRWHELIASSSPTSIRARFRAFFRRSTHEMAIDYCVIDYEREIAIVAEIQVGGAATLAGVAHILADANHDNAEFAVIVADPWQARGLGGLLLDYSLELARRWGIETVIAETDTANRAMLAVFRKRGFESEVCWQDAVVYLRKTLRPAA